MGRESKKDAPLFVAVAPFLFCAFTGSESGTDTEPLYEGAVTLNIYIAQVGKQSLSSSYQLHQPTSGVMVFLVNPQVVSQLTDTRGQKRNLYFG